MTRTPYIRLKSPTDSASERIGRRQGKHRATVLVTQAHSMCRARHDEKRQRRLAMPTDCDEQLQRVSSSDNAVADTRKAQRGCVRWRERTCTVYGVSLSPHNSRAAGLRSQVQLERRNNTG